jgi:Predicted ICC-like phosphoesterases
MTLKQFDLISDVHLDFHVTYGSNQISQERKVKKFVDSLMPDNPSQVLIIAGDLGHYNAQNCMLLESLKRFYADILIVRGNHDLYLISNHQLSKYDHSSLNRWQEMKELAKAINGVHVLEGDSITIAGVTFGGTGMWYDFSYGIKEMNQTYEAMHALWCKWMNDGRMIHGLPKFEEELKLLEQVIDQSDVIVTHVGPDWSKLQARYQSGLTSGFYFFDGSAILTRASGKVWCFGHTHDHYAYEKNGCYLINNALGYPGDNPGAAIRTVDFAAFQSSNCKPPI